MSFKPKSTPNPATLKSFCRGQSGPRRGTADFPTADAAHCLASRNAYLCRRRPSQAVFLRPRLRDVTKKAESRLKWDPYQAQPFWRDHGALPVRRTLFWKATPSANFGPCPSIPAKTARLLPRSKETARHAGAACGGPRLVRPINPPRLWIAASFILQHAGGLCWLPVLRPLTLKMGIENLLRQLYSRRSWKSGLLPALTPPDPWLGTHRARQMCAAAFAVRRPDHCPPSMRTWPRAKPSVCMVLCGKERLWPSGA